MKLGSRLKSGSSTCGCNTAPSSSPCDRRQIKSITKSGDKVLVVLDDCTYLEADFDVVDISVKSAECPKELPHDPVYSLGGDRIFDAMNVNQDNQNGG